MYSAISVGIKAEGQFCEIRSSRPQNSISDSFQGCDRGVNTASQIFRGQFI